MNTAKKITTGALMLALATILMWVSKVIPAPWLQGGSITIGSMVPIIIFSIMYGTKWGLCASFAYSLIQMIFGFYPPPTQTLINFILVILLDYVFSYGFLGFAGFFQKIFKKSRFSYAIAGFIVTAIRYICHIISGVLIWGVYAEEGQSVLAYSLIYNGTYMIPEIIITTVILALISRMKIFNK